ncbi:MAG: type II toxin-antitoxin system death-on-curing family toxin [Cyanobacteria bacterium J06597_16]
MIRTLSLLEIIELHGQIIKSSGGAAGIRDLGLLQSAVAQPLMTFGGEELYPSMAQKAGALGLSIVMNHPFVDGNKRAGHAAMEVFLVLNKIEVKASVDEQEKVILALAAGEMKRDAFVSWLDVHIARMQ